MPNSPKDFASYIQPLTQERQMVMTQLRQTILTHIDPAFEETIQYGMPSFVVPFQLYPAGYHCNPKDPLPFLSFASQKNFIALYHCGLYAEEALHSWFVAEFPKHSKHKLDMGKSCIRFKYMNDIPYELIGDLIEKMTLTDWVQRYETTFKR